MEDVNETSDMGTLQIIFTNIKDPTYVELQIG